MNILIFGSTGSTGRILVSQGLEKGYHITAFVRNPYALQMKNKNLVIFHGSFSNIEQIKKATRGQDVVISVLGNKTSNVLWKRNTIISDGLKNIVQGMNINKVKRFLFVSSFGVNKNVFLPEKLFIKIFLKNIFADILTQEKIIKESNLDWTIVRPARLINGVKTSVYKAAVDLPIGLFSKISRADVADFLLKSIQDKKVMEKTITLSY